MNGRTDKPADAPVRDPNPSAPSAAVVPIAAWLAIQLAAICLSALQFRWTNRYPQPAEHWALHVLLTAQIVGSVLMFPVLLMDWRRLMISVAVSWPLLVLAGILAEASTPVISFAGAYVAMWLTGLWVWRTALRTAGAQLLGVCILSALVLAGPILGYLGEEFRGVAMPLKGPIEAGLALLTRPSLTALVLPAALMALGLLATTALHARRSRWPAR